MTLLYKQYKWFTPHESGFTLVWDFVRSKGGTWVYKDFEVKVAYGYERSRDSSVRIDGVLVGSLNFLYERYADIQPVYQYFMFLLETAATKHQADEETRKEKQILLINQRDRNFKQRMLDKYKKEISS